MNVYPNETNNSDWNINSPMPPPSDITLEVGGITTSEEDDMLNNENSIDCEDQHKEQKQQIISFKQDINNKLQFITALVVWIVGCLLIIPASIPGVIISIQYSSDKCVKGTTEINVALDVWLGIACGGMILATIIVLLLLCINPRTKILKGFAVTINIMYVSWTAIGWYLLVNSTLECDHDSLWVMSIVYLCILSIAISSELVWVISTSSCVRRCCNTIQCCGCWRLCINRCLDINDIEDRLQYNIIGHNPVVERRIY